MKKCFYIAVALRLVESVIEDGRAPEDHATHRANGSLHGAPRAGRWEAPKKDIFEVESRQSGHDTATLFERKIVLLKEGHPNRTKGQ